MTKEALELNNLVKTELSTYFPLPGNILIELPKVEEKTKAGVIKGKTLAKEEAEKRARKYLIVAKVAKDSKFEVGDCVMLNAMILIHNQYTPLDFDNKMYGQFKESDIIGIYKFD